MRKEGRLARQWQILAAISQTRGGLTKAELMDLTHQSKANLQRDLKMLAETGLPVTTQSGRVRLSNLKELPPLGVSALQIAALHLARQQLAPLAGAGFMEALDALLSRLKPAERQQTFRFAASKTGTAPSVLQTIERAHRYRKRAAIVYRAASRGGRPAQVHIEPLLFNVADGDPYVLAYCVERRAERTYKLARISAAELTDESATHQPQRPPGDTFTHAVKAWSGDVELVRIKLDAAVAWLAEEYALPEQRTLKKPDGSVVVEAQVAGLVEARRWVLAWGGSAEALEPPALRNATRTELAAALRKYDGPGPAKRSERAPKQKSTDVPQRRLKDRESRAG